MLDVSAVWGEWRYRILINEGEDADEDRLGTLT